MKKILSSWLLTALGLALLGAGIALVKTIADPSGILLPLPYVMIGVGSGLFVQGMGGVLSRNALKKNPELEKQIEIEKKDERNIAIANRAKAQAYDRMIFIFGALMLSFALMNVDMAATLLLVFAYLVVVGFSVYYRIKYDKEM